jgi:hypothetical protein
MKIKMALLGSIMAACGLISPATPADRSKQAKVDRATAEKTALSRVPGGHIKEGELEKEHGNLVWSFDIAEPGSRNIIEVQVDAVNGAIVSLETETPAQQAKEVAADKAKSKNK